MYRATSERLVALDVFRGLAVAGMILVVSPGDWSHTYSQLRHAGWDGATIADMVFPAFLFGVGVAIGLSFPRPLGTRDDRRRFWAKLICRSVTLILLGLLVEATYVGAISLGAPYPGGPGLAHIRLPGILQRIGLCYGLAGAIAIVSARRDSAGLARIDPVAIAAIIAAILIGYWLLVTLVPVPGFGAGALTPAGSLPGFIDRTLFTEPHLWPLGSATGARPATYDPEGLLSTLPATANVLFGVLAAGAVRRRPTFPTRLVLIAVMLIVVGLSLDPFFVVNKRIWTSSFALLSSGVSALMFALLVVVMHSTRLSSLMFPLRVLGGNAVLAFLISTAFSRISGFPLLPEGGRLIAPQLWGYHRAMAIIPDPVFASFLCAMGILAITTLLIWPLHRRAIHFRI